MIIIRIHSIIKCLWILAHDSGIGITSELCCTRSRVYINFNYMVHILYVSKIQFDTRIYHTCVYTILMNSSEMKDEKNTFGQFLKRVETCVLPPHCSRIWCSVRGMWLVVWFGPNIQMRRRRRWRWVCAARYNTRALNKAQTTPTDAFESARSHWWNVWFMSGNLIACSFPARTLVRDLARTHAQTSMYIIKFHGIVYLSYGV